MNENETLNQKIKFMESLLYNLDIKAVSKELNYAVNDKRRVLNLMNLLNTVSETKIDTARHQEYIEYANQIKQKLYDKRKKQEVTSVTAGVGDTEVTPIDCFSYKIIGGNKIEITKFYRNLSRYVKILKIPKYINRLPVTSIGFYSFCSANIDKLVLPNSIINVDTGAFASAHIGYLEFFGGKIIPSGCFSGCNINYIRLNNGVKIIEDSAFSNARIKMLRIPSSVESIRFKAFFTDYTHTTQDRMYILFEHCEIDANIPEFYANVFPAHAILYTSNVRLLKELKEYKEEQCAFWDISDDVDEFELKWSIHTTSRDVKH